MKLLLFVGSTLSCHAGLDPASIARDSVHKSLSRADARGWMPDQVRHDARSGRGTIPSNGFGLWVLYFIFLCALPLTAHATVPTVEQPIATLRALDKMTARVEELDVPINEPLKFGTIIITARTCRVTTPEETPEAAAYLEVSEFKPGEKDVPIFQGWMFASSPALSAMEHPVYDIWVTGCKGPATPPTAPATQPPAAVPAK